MNNFEKYFPGRKIDEISRLRAENAELKQKLESVQASMYCDVVDANMENIRLKRELSHHKLKLCLTMAKWCDAMKSYFNESAFFDVYSNERMVFYERWHNRWLKIAEQFKDKEAKRCTQ